jgi:histidine triad (HIT) family protein
MTYDKNNIFAKIIRKEINSKIILEDDFFISFYDINPVAKIHALVIPKGFYINSFDFHKNASDSEIIGFYKGINKVIEILNLESFKMISNNGADGGQEVPHYHVHIIHGKKI